MSDAQETDEQYEVRMAKEFEVWCSERNVTLMASIISVPVKSPTGQSFFAQVPSVELKRKKVEILRPEVSQDTLNKAIQSTALKLVQ